MSKVGCLTDRGVDAKNEPGVHADGGGLWLQIDGAGGKRWCFRYVFRGEARELVLGGVPDVGLSEARNRAKACRAMLRAGIEPTASQPRVATPTVRPMLRALRGLLPTAFGPQAAARPAQAEPTPRNTAARFALGLAALTPVMPAGAQEYRPFYTLLPSPSSTVFNASTFNFASIGPNGGDASSTFSCADIFHVCYGDTGGNGTQASNVSGASGGTSRDVLTNWYYWTSQTSRPGVVSAQSLGGNGGRGGNVDTGFDIQGGQGGAGAPSGTVTLTNGLNLTNLGPQVLNYDGVGRTVYGLPVVQTKTPGIFAGSSGGAGGGGGTAEVGGKGTGGTGGGGAAGSDVNVTNAGWIVTGGDDSAGIVAQSLGGAGGAGGTGGGASGNGGAGASSGHGGNVTVNNTGLIATGQTAFPWGYGPTDNGALQVGTVIEVGGKNAPGIVAQSIGGFSGSGGRGTGVAGFGGGSESSGDGGTVSITNSGAIYTGQAHSPGIFGQSIGGGGGAGGSGQGIGSVGGSGSSGGNGGQVTVGNSGNITANKSEGIYIQSVGGGGGRGGTADSLVSIGGSGSATSGGGGVTVTNTGSINAAGSAIFAQSVGGGGGSGGSTVGLVSIGGSGGGGGAGGAASVTSGAVVNNGVAQAVGSTTLQSTEAHAPGIVAQSVGGGGGHGGAAVAGGFAGAVALGGKGGQGGSAGNVEVVSGSQITTQGENAHGILAQSVGGGGGNGGVSIAGSIPVVASASVAIGGSGGGGGSPGTVGVTNVGGSIFTYGSHADGILAQSVGGGGGSGGFSVAGTLDFGGNRGYGASVALGGTGAGGGNGNTVTVTSQGGTINTGFRQDGAVVSGDFASGIFAQSVGGGGGKGGFAIAANSGALASAAVSLGGNGGGGGAGGAVSVTSKSEIVTIGHNAYGILAQSVGGGGGSGGLSVSGNLSTLNGQSAFSVGVGLGGAGAGGGNGGTVTVVTDTPNGQPALNVADIGTGGNFASAILAQSVGGGGGSGGSTVAAGISGPFSADFSMGGRGGNGGSGGTVSVTTRNVNVVTGGVGSHGIQAQSVGGGGGSGGLSVSGSLSVGEEGGSLSESFGGTGGGGGRGGQVSVTTNNAITTYRDQSSGIMAQSLGGGGGAGGFSGAFALAPTASVALGLGGVGGAGNAAGTVTVNSEGGIIAASGTQSNAIFAQSLGGGGGKGGMAIAVSAAGPEGVPNAISLTIGGSGGTGANADAVNVTSGFTGSGRNATQLSTLGDHAAAIQAQSIGGGGGDGAISVSFAASGFAFALPDVPKLNLGGKAGGGGDGSSVTVTNAAPIMTGGFNRATGGQGGDFSPGILAQSVGGGGGTGGVKISGDVSIDPETGVGVSLGATGVNGASGGNAGDVTVTGAATANIITNGSFNAPGILAQSVGGGGGTGGWSFAVGVKALAAPEKGPALALAFGGTGGAGGTAGDVTLSQIAGISTVGDSSQGVFAQSVGGGGGTGGLAVGVSGTNQSNVFGLGALTASFGGEGGSGAKSGNVSVATLANDSLSITTQGHSSAGMFAQSVGGGGGNGGGSVAVSMTLGPKSGSSLSVAHGGNGGTGGASGNVTVTNYAGIATGNNYFTPQNGYQLVGGNDSPGIFAQSVGGGGGNGGFSISSDLALGSEQNGVGISASFGGTGGSGNTSGSVTVNNLNGTLNGAISTQGSRASGIVAQSVAGGGGHGGLSVSANASTVNQLNLSMGGKGGGGADAGAVSVTNASLITPLMFRDQNTLLAQPSGADHSYGISAQSIGGGGGAGGLSVAGNVTLQGASGASGDISAGVSLGGNAGAAGSGSSVTVSNAGSILTGGNHSAGILAHSIGGGGGAGGLSVAGTLAYAVNGLKSNPLAIAIGGSGGAAGAAGDVTVTTQGPATPYGIVDFANGRSIGGAGPTTSLIGTVGLDSPAIVAQSVSGGGGSGGTAIAAAVNNLQGLPISVFVGGSGGTGNASGNVTVNDGATLQSGGTTVPNGSGGTAITTTGNASPGIVAQSITGGGGLSANSIGGDVSNAGAPSFRVGATNSQYNVTSGATTVTSSSTVATSGSDSTAIIAQSIGGGGGVVQLAIQGKADWSQGTINVGGDNNNPGSRGIAQANTATVTTNGASITTTGDRSSAIIAQSIGGGGGIADVAVAQNASAPLSMTIGGGTSNGSNWGNGAATSVTNSAQIAVSGRNAHGIVAQSIGGGGGLGIFASPVQTGSAAIGNTPYALGDAGAVTVSNSAAIATTAAGSYGILVQSVGGGGGVADYVSSAAAPAGLDVAATLWNNGTAAASGSGGAVSVTNGAVITTSGAGAVGIFAQSVGGSGGLDIAAGKTTGGYGKGGAGDVTVSVNSPVTTSGNAAHGVVAQSIGGDQQGGNVTVTAAANVTASGSGSYGVLGQSFGGAGFNRLYTYTQITVNQGATVTGGSGTGAGIAAAGGSVGVNIKNRGTITTASGISGMAVLAGNSGGIEVDNDGTITGSVSLGTASMSPAVASQGVINNPGNSFVNRPGGIFNSGATVDLGTAGASSTGGSNTLLLNDGVLAPFGAGTVGTTTVKGDFQQGVPSGVVSGSLNVDIDVKANTSDLIAVTGTTTLYGGTVAPSFLNATSLRPDTPVKAVLLTSAGGITNNGIAAQPSAVMTYALDAVSDPKSLRFVATPNFAPAGLTKNQQAVGSAVNNLLASGRSVGSSLASSDALLSSYIGQPDAASLGKLYDKSGTAQSTNAGSAATANLGHAYMASPMNRMQSVLGDGGDVTNTASAGHDVAARLGMLAYNGSTASVASLLSPAPVAEKRDRFGVWLEPFNYRAYNDADAANAYTNRSVGATGGVDYLFADGLVGGIGLGSVETTTTFDAGGARGSNRNQYVSLYGGYSLRGTNLQSVISYGTHHSNNSRTLSLGAATLTPTTAYGGKSLSAAFEINHRFQIEGYRIQPFASLSYSRLKEDRSQETGAGGLELAVDARTTHSLVSNIGSRFSKPFAVASGTLMPGLSLSWKHEHTSGLSSVPTSFAGSTDIALPIESQHTVRDRGVLGTDLQFVKKGGTVLALRLQAEKGAGYYAHGLFGYFRSTF